MVHGIVLQAPVSDREALLVERRLDDPELTQFKELAAQMISQGKGDEPLPRGACEIIGPPDVITAYRFNSLTQRMADDDMFSSDLRDDELMEKLGHVNSPCLLVMSADDEYVPSFVDPALLATRLANAMAVGPAEACRAVILSSGGHGIRSADGQTEFLKSMKDFILELDDKQLCRLDWETALAFDLQKRASVLPSGRPLLVALAGMPGAGKTTLCSTLRRLLHPHGLIVPVDGFHIPLEDLKLQGDETVYRRGAADTFDPEALRRKLEQVKSGENEVSFPDFDHVPWLFLKKELEF